MAGFTIRVSLQCPENMFGKIVDCGLQFFSGELRMCGFGGVLIELGLCSLRRQLHFSFVLAFWDKTATDIVIPDSV